MKKYILLFSFLGLFCLGIGAASADIIPEGTHYFDRCVKITNLDDYPQAVLIAYVKGPMIDGYEATQINNNECLNQGYKFNTLDVYLTSSDYFSLIKLDNLDIDQPELTLLAKDFNVGGDYIDDADERVAETIEYQLTQNPDHNYDLYKSMEIIDRNGQGDEYNVFSNPYPENEMCEDENVGGNDQDMGKIMITNQEMYNKLKGRIILKALANGEAYYINPKMPEMYYLADPDTAFFLMQHLGIGITNDDLNKIPIGLATMSGKDSDEDGLPDIMEQALGTDKSDADTDDDGHNDFIEVLNHYNPLGPEKLTFDPAYTQGRLGNIYLQVQSYGEAWYINPADGQRYFMGRPADAQHVMRDLSLGISNEDFDRLTK